MRVIDLFVCDSILCWILEILRLFSIGLILSYNVPSFGFAIIPFAAVYFVVKVSTPRKPSVNREQFRTVPLAPF